MYEIMLTKDEYDLVLEALKMYHDVACGDEAYMGITGPTLPNKIRALMCEVFSTDPGPYLGDA